MKILRKKDDFKKMPDKSVDDILVINKLIKDGWKYCSRKEYKDFYKNIEETNSKKKK